MRRIEKLDRWLQDMINRDPVTFWALATVVAVILFGAEVILERFLR
jgi:hypothetical protein